MIAVVASAGGVEAVSAVLEGLPGDLDAAVVVAIHQRPDHANRLVEVLARRSVLPVLAAEHGQPLSRGLIVVAGPGEHVLLTPGPAIATIVAGAVPPSRPSADLLLTTLAIACGRRATAVVLSGAGHDGATGATAIHSFGGTVLASDEASSQHFSMPWATIQRDGAIDHVVPLAEMAGLLASIADAHPL